MTNMSTDERLTSGRTAGSTVAPQKRSSVRSVRSTYEAHAQAAAMKKAAGKSNFGEALDALAKHQQETFDRLTSDDEMVHFDIVVQDMLGKNNYADAYRYMERIRSITDVVMRRIRPRAVEQGVEPRPEFDPMASTLGSTRGVPEKAPSALRMQTAPAKGKSRRKSLGLGLTPGRAPAMLAASAQEGMTGGFGAGSSNSRPAHAPATGAGHTTHSRDAADGHGRDARHASPGARVDPLTHPVVRGRIELLQQEIANLKTEVAAVRELSQVQRRTAKEKQDEVSELLTRLQERGAEIQQQAQRIKRLEEERRKVEGERDEVAVQLQRTEGELRKANRLNSSMRSKVMVAEEQARMQGQDESQLRYMVIFLEEQLTECRRLLKVRSSALGNFKESHQDRVRALEARVFELEGDLRVRDALLAQAGVSVVRQGSPGGESDGAGGAGARAEGGEGLRQGPASKTVQRWEDKLRAAKAVYARGALLQGLAARGGGRGAGRRGVGKGAGGGDGGGGVGVKGDVGAVPGTLAPVAEGESEFSDTEDSVGEEEGGGEGGVAAAVPG